MESGQESLAQLPAPLDQFGCDQSCVCRSMVLPITCWTVTCGGAPRIVACSSNWQWPHRVGVSGFGSRGHIAHKQYNLFQNCDLPLLYVHPSNCSHILLSSIRGHQKIQWPWHHKAGLPQNTRDSWWPVNRIMAVLARVCPTQFQIHHHWATAKLCSYIFAMSCKQCGY